MELQQNEIYIKSNLQWDINLVVTVATDVLVPE